MTGRPLPDVLNARRREWFKRYRARRQRRARLLGRAWIVSALWIVAGPFGATALEEDLPWVAAGILASAGLLAIGTVNATARFLTEEPEVEA